jgi:hypothetical protein
MSRLRAPVAIATSFTALAALAALSSVSYVAETTERSLLRLSWRVRGERIERCRRPTARELAGVPAHMRRETICEAARVAPYRLRVAIDDRPVVDGAAPGSGVASDRPMYLLRDVAVAPGRHRVRVVLERVPGHSDEDDSHRDESRRSNIGDDDHDRNDRDGDDRDDGDDDDETPDDRSRRQRALPRRLELDTTVTMRGGAILLVTYDAESRRFVMLGPDSVSDDDAPFSPTPR